MPLSPIIQEWIDAHMPEPLNQLAQRVCLNCLEYSVLMPVGFLVFKQGEDLAYDYLPVVEGFKNQAGKDAFVDAMQRRAIDRKALMTLMASEAWTIRLAPQSRAAAEHLLNNPPVPSRQPDRIEVLILNWEHYDPQGKVIAQIATFRILREGRVETGKKIGLERMDHLCDQNGGQDRLEGRMAHILVPRESSL